MAPKANNKVEVCDHPSAWDRAGLLADGGWIRRLGDEATRELSRAVTTPSHSARAERLPSLASQLADIGQELEFGRGVVLLQGLPLDGLSEAQCERLFGIVTTQMGELIVQDTAGTLIDRVEDRGRSYDDISVRGYTTNAQLTPHCDSGDFIGLLCVRPAQSGGINTLTSSVGIFNRIARRHPHLLPPLLRGFHYNIRGNGPPGPWVDVTAHRVPVFSVNAGRVSCRFNEKAIKTAAELPGVAPLTSLELEAVDKIVELASDPELMIDVALESGDLLLLSNHSVLHNRTAFVDSDQPGSARLMLRAWINIDYGRDLEDAFADHYNTGPKQGPFVAAALRRQI